MGKAGVKWTAFALMQLDLIYNYVYAESKSNNVAFEQITKIFDRTEQLINFPESGQNEELLKGKDVRYLIEGNYKILYKYSEDKDEVIIIDIFHTKQNPKKIKRKSI
jgi:toxin ParE1/3/4